MRGKGVVVQYPHRLGSNAGYKYGSILDGQVAGLLNVAIVLPVGWEEKTGKIWRAVGQTSKGGSYPLSIQCNSGATHFFK